MTVSSLKNKIMGILEQTTIQNDNQGLIRKFNEETLELSLAIRDKDHENAKEEIADCLIVLAQMMHLVGFTERDLDNKLLDVLKRYGGGQTC